MKWKDVEVIEDILSSLKILSFDKDFSKLSTTLESFNSFCEYLNFD